MRETVGESVGIVSSIIKVVSEWLTGIISLVADAFGGVIDLFYSSETGLTVVGTLLLFGLAFGFVSLAFGFIRSLINR